MVKGGQCAPKWPLASYTPLGHTQCSIKNTTVTAITVTIILSLFLIVFFCQTHHLKGSRLSHVSANLEQLSFSSFRRKDQIREITFSLSYLSR